MRVFNRFKSCNFRSFSQSCAILSNSCFLSTDSEPVVIVALVALQTLAGIYDDGPLEFASASPQVSLPARLATIEAAKLAMSAVLRIQSRAAATRSRHTPSRSTALLWASDAEGVEEEPLVAMSSSGRRSETWRDQRNIDTSMSAQRARLHSGTPCSVLTLAFLAIAYCFRNYIAYTATVLADKGTVNRFSTSIAFFSAILSCLFLSRSLSSGEWYLILLQICGFLITQNTSTLDNFPQVIYCILFGLTLYTSLNFVLNDHIYNAHDISTPHGLNITIFTCALALYIAIIIFQLFFGGPEEFLSTTAFFPVHPLLIILFAASDVACMIVLFRYGAIVVGTASALSSFLLAEWSRGFHQPFPLTSVIGSALAVFAFIAYVSQQQNRRDEPESQGSSKARRYRFVLGTVVLSLAYIYISYTVTVAGVPRQIFHSATSSVTSFRLRPPFCERKELLSPAYHSGPRTYHEFDNVLLIVFFSHARYDVNLDSYKDIYSEFFPNMVFVGPASREDKGFAHSYDVYVDSYQSEEDLSDPTFYKMAGRMAHHMLYTVMREHICYEGYLWAPFDTLLNIPRLQQFRKDRFWYHSPFGEYVPNPAMGDQWDNPASHAPPAQISPDPALDLTATYRGWEKDWWWGEPHVGLAVCMRAFERVPEQMRVRLAAQTNGTTRLLGGSADTAYIPGQLRAAFLETLGLFLETDCFLEIAVPSALHLVAPEGQPILFIDHWWIWTPPFNATFVRQKWVEGMEVDTFHTFHWGDKGADGVWRGIPENIPDVRRLLQDSAERQGTKLTSI